MQVFPSKPCCNGIPLNVVMENKIIDINNRLDPCCNGIPLNDNF